MKRFIYIFVAFIISCGNMNAQSVPTTEKIDISIGKDK